jgi:hypothetical protein
MKQRSQKPEARRKKCRLALPAAERRQILATGASPWLSFGLANPARREAQAR